MFSRRLEITAMAALLGLGWIAPARADVEDIKTDRLREYQSRRLEFSAPSSASYLIKQGTGTASVPVSDRLAVSMAADTELQQRLSDIEFWRGASQLSWTLGVPVGAWVFFDNFLGTPRPAGIKDSVPAPLVAFYPGNDWRSYAIATAGGALAAWGLANIGGWVMERLDFLHPNLLSVQEASASVKTANERLATELALAPADIASASETLAAAVPASGSNEVPGALKGVEGTAAFYLPTAIAKVRNERGEGYRLYLVYSHDLTDNTGKLTRGAWNYCFYHPTKVEALEVNVPVFGASPKVVAAQAAFDRWKAVPDLVARWKVDSPRALADLTTEFGKRGLPWLGDEFTMFLYPNFGTLSDPLWKVDPGTAAPLSNAINPSMLGLDASNEEIQDLRVLMPGTLPTSAGAAPAR